MIHIVCIFSLGLSNFSDPPLEEDDVPPGEWLCHRCRTKPKFDVSSDVFRVEKLNTNKYGYGHVTFIQGVQRRNKSMYSPAVQCI